LPKRTPAIATINTTNFMNIFKRFSIITKFRLKRKRKWIYSDMLNNV
jgi:hypothetical protein